MKGVLYMESMPININGYDTYFAKCKDTSGKYLLITVPPTASKDISNICGTFVDGHLIKMIDYTVVNDIRFIKAYY